MIAITGATGQLGRLVIESLLERGVDAREIVATVRNLEKASFLADKGIEIRRADYTERDTLKSAFRGIDRLLLISSSDVGSRVDHHRNVLDAAKASDVGFLAYTSAPYAGRSPMQLASDHRVTEEMIRASGIPFSILRNGWYMENYTGTIAQALEHGVVMGSAGEGKISAATRKDLAEAAAVVISSDGHAGAVYELGGDDAFTMSEFATEITKQSGKEVIYRDLPVDEYTKSLVGFGIPEGYAAALADSDAAASDGFLHIDTGDLSRLIGHPTTTLETAVAETLR